MPVRTIGYAYQMNDPLVAANSINTFTGPQNLIKTTGNAAYVASPCMIPAYYLKTGTTIRVEASGTVANASTTPTMSFGLGYGATALAVSSALTETSGATIQVPWWLRLTMVVRSDAVPSAMPVLTHGWITWSTTLSAVTLTYPVPVTALATVNVDNTAAAELSVQATCGTSAVGNTITLHQLTIEEITQT